MTDTPIRTSWETLDGDPACEQAWVYLPADWPDDIESVLVVAGLPEGAELRRLCDVPEGWEWQNDAGNWHPAHRFAAEDECTGYVLCRPKPVPAPPATEKVPWHEAVSDQRRLPLDIEGHVKRATGAGHYSDGFCVLTRVTAPGGTWSGPIVPVDADGSVTVLVEAPTGDDEPQMCPPCEVSRRVTEQINGGSTETQQLIALRSLLDEEGPEALVEAVLAAVRALRDGGTR